jgi:hypothetical protein
MMAACACVREVRDLRLTVRMLERQVEELKRGRTVQAANSKSLSLSGFDAPSPRQLSFNFEVLNAATAVPALHAAR